VTCGSAAFVTEGTLHRDKILVRRGIASLLGKRSSRCLFGGSLWKPPQVSSTARAQALDALKRACCARVALSA